MVSLVLGVGGRGRRKSESESESESRRVWWQFVCCRSSYSYSRSLMSLFHTPALYSYSLFRFYELN